MEEGGSGRGRNESARTYTRRPDGAESNRVARQAVQWAQGQRSRTRALPRRNAAAAAAATASHARTSTRAFPSVALVASYSSFLRNAAKLTSHSTELHMIDACVPVCLCINSRSCSCGAAGAIARPVHLCLAQHRGAAHGWILQSLLRRRLSCCGWTCVWRLLQASKRAYRISFTTPTT